MSKKLHVFVGSSTEGIPFAKAVKWHFDHDYDVTLWNGNFFQPNSGTLETLLNSPKNFDYAVFILSDDDFMQSRGKEGVIPRANVVFELGLFMGAFGPKRVFGIWSDDPKMFIPSDFAGVTVIYYNHKGIDTRDPDACYKAVSAACTIVDAAIRRDAISQSKLVSFSLTESSAQSIAAYLKYKGQNGSPFLKIDRDTKIAKDHFDMSCQQAWEEVDIYQSTRNALHQDFGLYVSATGAFGKNLENRRDLAYCMRSHSDGETYLSHIINTSTKVNTFIKQDAREIHKKKFAHWLLDSGINPVPLAVVVQCRKDSDWSASVFSVYAETLLFSISTSATSNDYKLVHDAFRGKISVPYIEDRLNSLKEWYDGQSDYMGTDIRSILYLPIHGRPSVTLNFLTRHTITITGAGHSGNLSPADADDSDPISLSVDELLAVRLGGERFVAALNHYHSAPDDRRRST